MCGKVTDRTLLSYYYARADLFLFPSLYDASSIVQIEAASQKTPTVFLEGAVTANTVENNIKLQGLIPDADYRDEESGIVYGGDELIYKGIWPEYGQGDYKTITMHLKRLK